MGGGPAGPPTVQLPETGLTADQLAIVVNLDDPLSADVAAAYAAARGVAGHRIVALSLGTAGQLDAAAFSTEKATLDAQLDDGVQALLLAFTTPYQVGCMGTSAAFALGFDETYCSTPCAPTRGVRTFDSDSVAMWDDHGVRPAMMLSAPTLSEAEAIIQRGLDADDSAPTGTGWLVRTTDAARAVRYPAMEALPDAFEPGDLDLRYRDNSDGAGDNAISGETDVLFYLTGLTTVPDIATNSFRPGALADHLTSYGGVLSDTNSQMPATDWLAGGATASYGTAHEPCNYTQKFPDPTVLVSRYFRGETALEAYWKSVAWPGEGNFVGEPLARPWSPSVTWTDGRLEVSTTGLDRDTSWQLEASESEAGPWSAVGEGVAMGDRWRRVTITLEDAWHPHYRLIEATD